MVGCRSNVVVSSDMVLGTCSTDEASVGSACKSLLEAAWLDVVDITAAPINQFNIRKTNMQHPYHMIILLTCHQS